MADEDKVASQSIDSFVTDGQVQSDTALAQDGHRQEPKVIVVTVQDPSIDQEVQHSEQKQVLTPDPALAPRKKRSPGDLSWIDEHRRSGLPPPAPPQTHKSRTQPPSGPSRKDRAEAGSSRAQVASPAISTRFSISSYVSSNRSRSPLRRSRGRQEISSHSTPLSNRREERSREVCDQG